MNRLLELIDEGDADAILSEDELISRFNELLKYELIAVEYEKVYLTEKGKEAKNKGVEAIINQEKHAVFPGSYTNNNLKKDTAIRFSNKRLIKSRKFWISGFIMLLFALLVLLVI